MPHPTQKQLARLARRHREIAEHLEAAAKGIAVISEQLKTEVENERLTSAARLPSRPQTSLNKIRDYLRDNGATKRPKLSEATGIPLGTIAGILTLENGFERISDGWIVSKKGEEKST
jgi:hypothetical protein